MEDNGFTEFLLWEKATKDTIDFKKAYVDMAGDLIAGLLLSQIVFWFLPTRSGKSKIRVFKEGEWWLAKSYHDWDGEIRITKDQARRAVGILRDKNLIITKRFMFNGAPTMHIRINAGVFLDGWNCVVAQYEVGYNPLGSGLQPKSITETTTEITVAEEEKKEQEKKEEIKFEDLASASETLTSQFQEENPEAIGDASKQSSAVEELARQLAPPIDLVWGYNKKVDAKLLHAARQLLADCKGDIDGILDALDDYCETDGEWARENLDDPHGLATLVGRRYVKLLGQNQRQSAALSASLDLAELSQQALAERRAEVTERDSWWEKQLQELQGKMDASTFNSLLRETTARRDNGTVTIFARDQRAVEWLDNRLRKVIERTLAGFGVTGKVEFRVKEANDD